MSNKKNDSFPQKNVSLGAAQLPREPQVRVPDGLEGEQAESSPFVLFNKTSLIGVGVLVLALISVALPYSLGWLSSSEPVAESSETDPKDPPEEGSDSLTALSSQNDPWEHAVNKIDDNLPDLIEDDFNASNPYAPSLPGEYEEFSTSLERFEEEQTFTQMNLATTEEKVELLSIPDSEEDWTIPEEPLLPQKQPEQVTVQPQPVFREPLNSSPKQTVPQRNQVAREVSDRENSPLSPLPTSQSIQPLVDHSAINARTFPEAASSRTTLRPAKFDPNPDTTHPIDENDNLFPEPDTGSITHVSYAAQSLVEPSSVQEPPQSAARPAAARKEYRPRYAQVREGSRSLPNADGQLWCPYDITPFTRVAAAASGTRPEQTLVKWIRRQTGEEFWHSEPFGILSATPETLYVYHTPEVQEMVAEIVDRFVNPQGEADAYMFRIVSLNGPSWLTQFHTNLKPIRIDTPGAQGWLLAKEDYVKMIPELARRSDYKELCSPQFPIRNGREYIVSANVPKTYTSNVLSKDDVWPGYAAETAVINEGYSMMLIPLSGVDGASADLMIKCESIQVEKMHTVALNVPSRVTTRQRVTIESPQISQFQLDEQIHWPKDKVLVLSLGTIPVPSAAQHSDTGKLIPKVISGSPAARGHVLLFVECNTIK